MLRVSALAPKNFIHSSGSSSLSLAIDDLGRSMGDSTGENYENIEYNPWTQGGERGHQESQVDFRVKETKMSDFFPYILIALAVLFGLGAFVQVVVIQFYSYFISGKSGNRNNAGCHPNDDRNDF